MAEQLFKIDGIIESPEGGVNSDDLFFDFIMWIEEHGMTFGGFFNECDEEGELLEVRDAQEHKE